MKSNSILAASWAIWNYFMTEGQAAKLVTLAAHPDGRMHAVMAGLDNQLWHNEQTAAGYDDWTNWTYLSDAGQKATALALAAHSDGRMHAVMAGLDGQLWHNEQTQPKPGPGTPWTNWTYLSDAGQKAKLVTLAAHPDGRMHAVMAGLDNQLWHNEQTAAGVGAPWTNWHYLSDAGQKAKLVTLAAHPDGRMHAVMAGLDNQLWHNEQTAAGVGAPWTNWQYLSKQGDAASALALAVHADGRAHAMMAGLDNQLWQNEQTESGVGAPWTNWTNMATEVTGKMVALAPYPDGHLGAVVAAP